MTEDLSLEGLPLVIVPLPRCACGLWSWDPTRCLTPCLCPHPWQAFPSEDSRCSPMVGHVGRVTEPTPPLIGKLAGAEHGRASRVSL